MISPPSLKDRIRILRADLSFVILKQVEGFSLWPQSTHQMMTTRLFESFLSHLRDFRYDDIVLGGNFNLGTGQ